MYICASLCAYACVLVKIVLTGTALVSYVFLLGYLSLLSREGEERGGERKKKLVKAAAEPLTFLLNCVEKIAIIHLSEKAHIKRFAPKRLSKSRRLLINFLAS